MKSARFLILALLMLLVSCVKETGEPSHTVNYRTIHYEATAVSTPDSKATLDGSEAPYHYVFEEGDRLFLSYEDEGEGEGEGVIKLYGFLTLVSGAGATTALFEGDLACAEGFEPIASTPVEVTLVSANDELHTVRDGKIEEINSYPSNAFASSFSDAVQKYSIFKDDAGTFGSHSFTLSQHTSFLLFRVTLDPDKTSSGESVHATLTNNSGADTICSADVEATDDSGDVEAVFVAALSDGISLSNARLVIREDSEDFSFIIDNKNLSANYYYNIIRSTVVGDYFTIEASANDTSVTFQYASAGDGVQYSTDGLNWTNYVTTDGAITLAEAGDKIYLRGRRTSYNNSSGSTPLFTVDDPAKICYIYGDIMYLMCDSNYKPLTSITTANAFRATFKNATWINGKSDKKLKLSATTISGSNCYQEMFSGCTGLTLCPVETLPATGTAMSYIYTSMFQGCTNMTMAPAAISATVLGERSCYMMFSGCTALSSVPTITLTDLSGANNLYQMFYQCTSLTSADGIVLNAPTLTEGCYRGMFSGCSALTTGPSITATSLSGTYNCHTMFFGCSSLISAGSINIATRAAGGQCFREMFSGCTSLATAPTLNIDVTTPSGTLQFYQMFLNCEALTSASTIDISVGDLPTSVFSQMFKNCTSLDTAPVLDIDVTTPSGTQQQFYQMFYGCSSLTSASTVEISLGVLPTSGCNQMFSGCTQLTTPPVFSFSSLSGETNCYRMFYECSALNPISTLNLDAEELTARCYEQMFYGCSSLSAIPAPDGSSFLPAETLANSCYSQMFQGCSSLTTLPAGLLPAMDLSSAELCYNQMFQSCTKLSSLPNDFVLPATELSFACYRKMFDSCSKLTSVSPNLLPATELKVACYVRMFYGNSELTSAPILPAIEPASACYFNTFRDCKKLSYVKCLLYLSDEQRTTERIDGYSDKGDPTVAELRVFEVCNLWSVFNKWLAGTKNTSDCNFYYNENLPSTVLESTIAGQRLVPNQWVCTPVSVP